MCRYIYRLECKPATHIIGSRVLGLHISGDPVDPRWGRDNEIEEPPASGMSKRDVFSFCGRLLGHYPVAGWLRPACGFLKRLSCEGNWNSIVGPGVSQLVCDLWQRLSTDDPVGGMWKVRKDGECRLWCDASSLGLGACLEVDDRIVEDASWLRPKHDVSHINVAELEAVVKGVSLAVDWGFKSFELCVDSASVFAWLKSIVTGDKKIRTRGLGELLVRRRLFLLREVIDEWELNISPRLVKSVENKADRLTRVPKSWLSPAFSVAAVGDAGEVSSSPQPEEVSPSERISKVHDVTHFGVDRTLSLVRMRFPEHHFTKKEVRSVIRKCARCRSIDPQPVKLPRGTLGVSSDWHRVAVDVTHFDGKRYLTLVDCGPSRFAVWRQLVTESANELARVVISIFRERGPPVELLTDNGPSFKTVQFVQACSSWGVRVLYRCAYRPQGNGIIERNHRTIKRMAARAHRDPLDMVFFYNLSPLRGSDEQSAPSRALYSYRWRYPVEVTPLPQNPETGGYRVGEEVLVKPSDARCTTPWQVAHVTGITPEGGVEVNGVHRHLSHLRHVSESDTSEEDSSSDAESISSPIASRIGARVRAKPWFYDSRDFE
jgi:transposase InsO family protein